MCIHFLSSLRSWDIRKAQDSNTTVCKAAQELFQAAVNGQGHHPDRAALLQQLATIGAETGEALAAITANAGRELALSLNVSCYSYQALAAIFTAKGLDAMKTAVTPPPPTPPPPAPPVPPAASEVPQDTASKQGTKKRATRKTKKVCFWQWRGEEKKR